MSERIEKELSDLDHSKVDLKNGSWIWGYGGHPLRNDEGSLSFYPEGGGEVRYKFPPWLNHLIKQAEKNAERSVRMEIRSALGF